MRAQNNYLQQILPSQSFDFLAQSSQGKHCWIGYLSLQTIFEVSCFHMPFLMQHVESYDLFFFLLCSTTKLSMEEDEEIYKMWAKNETKLLKDSFKSSTIISFELF